MRSFWMIVSVGVSTLLGVMLADRFQCHALILFDMRVLCGTVRLQSVCGGGSVLQMLKSFLPRSQAVQAFLQRYREHLRQHPSEVSWKLALEETILSRQAFLGVTQQEAYLFLQIERAMGSFLSCQQDMLQDLEQELEKLLADARQQCKTRGTMCTKLGLIFGVAAAVLWM